MSQITYRTATVHDVEAIRVLTDQMLSHTGLGVATAPKIRSLVLSPRCTVRLALADDRLIGYTCGILHESIFNDVVRATDIGIFVLPEYRQGGVAVTLLSSLETWARNHGAKELWLGQTTGDNPELVAKFYTKSGFKLKGFNAVKEL